MASSTAKTKSTQSKAIEKVSSYSAVIERLNNIMGSFSGLPMDSVYNAFGRALGYWANQPQIQNRRIKALNPLPCDYSKDDLNKFLVNPQNSEYELQQISEGLRWTNYSYAKLIKSYSDMLEFHSLVMSQNATADEVKSDGFKRESRLVDKFIKSFKAKETGRKVAMQALTQGKVFYVPRYSVDKSHNKANYFFLQELPKRWCTLIGKNSLSNWTLSFNLMYFLQPGTDYRQFGDLFEPYMNSFNEWLSDDNRKPIKGKVVYASRNNADKFDYEVKAWSQNGVWMYFVSLPIDRVWTFEIDESTGIVASPLSGLMQTFAQQADYEAAQLSLILNPLIKIFTGEIPYTKAENSTQEDGYRLSLGGLQYFVNLFYELMKANQTAGAGLYAAPLENIKSHDFTESAGANDINQKFLTYGMSKSGLQSLVPVTDRPTQGMAEISAKLESQYAQNIYRQFERMLNYILETLNLTWEWRVQFWGDVYGDDQARANALKLIDKGDLWGWYLLCSLDDISIYERVNANQIVKASGFMQSLEIPQTAYTQSGKSQPKSDTGGAPQKQPSDQEQTRIEKQVEVTEE